jgi:hypothetical protein
MKIDKECQTVIMAPLKTENVNNPIMQSFHDMRAVMS